MTSVLRHAPGGPAPGPAGAGGPDGGAPERRVVLRLTARRAVRSGVLWGYVFALYVAAQAYGYAATYKTAASRALLARSFGRSSGLDALVGPARDLGTVAGYTAWKSVGILAVLGAVWALLLATKLTRGEEDAGRFELLLSGQTTRRGAARQALAGLGLGVLAVFVLTAAATALIGLRASIAISWHGAVFFAAAVTAGAAMFMAVGALLAQLCASRRQAATYAGALLGVSFALRMVADASPSQSWLAWATPLGWIDQLHPLTGSDAGAFVPIVVLIVLCVAGTVVVAGRRDMGGSLLPDRQHARPHTALLGGPVGLALRNDRTALVGWLAGICGFGLLLGSTASQAASAIDASPGARAALGRLGATGGADRAYIGVSFLVVGLLVALSAAHLVSGIRREESEGFLEHLMVRPCSRPGWLVRRLGLSAVLVAVAGVAGGLATWVGAHGLGMGFGAMVAAGANVVPAAVVVLGLGTLAFGLAPRLATAAAYGVLAWSLLIELLGGVVNSNHWLLDTSLFHQVAAAPAVSPDWVSGGVLVGLGLLAATVGVVAFSRRDLCGE